MKKSIVVGGILSCFFVNTILSIPYIIRQPQSAADVVKGVSYHVLLAPQDLDAINATHRHLIERVMRQARRVDTGEDKIEVLERLSHISTGNEAVDKIFNNIGINLNALQIITIPVFDRLLPLVNVTHNYFQQLMNFSVGPANEVFVRLHTLFVNALYQLANERYQEGLSYWNRDNREKALQYMTIAQALLYRLSQEHEKARALFEEIDQYQPVSFKEELKKLGIVATGGVDQQ